MSTIAPAFAGVSVGELSRRAADIFGSDPYLIDERGSLSCGEVDDAADRLAHGLKAAGLGPGNRLAIWLPNSREWVITFLAGAKIGAAIVPINTRYTADEAHYLLEMSGARALVLMRQKSGTDYIQLLRQMAGGGEAALAQTPKIASLPSLRHLILVDEEPEDGTQSFAEAISSAAKTDLGSISSSDLLLICFTSGSTGKPKGVMHDHRVIVQSTRVGEAMRMGRSTRILGHMPFHHSAGLFMALLPSLALGSALVLMEEWRATQALDLIERHHVSRLGGIPTHFYDLVDEQLRSPRDLSSLEAAWIGGSAVMRSSFVRIIEVLGLKRLMSTYGMTENTISTTFNHWDDPIERCCSNSAPKLSDCEVRIVEPASLAEVAKGSEGELLCRGPTVVSGYFGDAAATADVLTGDGWLGTGDMAIIDDDGYITITGRLKEMLKVGGVNVSPIEVEQVLVDHPAVRAAAVVGVPDDRLVEVPYGIVKLKDNAEADAESILEHCRARIARFKVPRHIEFVSELPRTDTGKIKRTELARRARAKLLPAAGEPAPEPGYRNSGHPQGGEDSRARAAGPSAAPAVILDRAQRQSRAAQTRWHESRRPRQRSVAVIYDQPVLLNERQAGVAIEGAHNQKVCELQRLAVDTHGFTYFAIAAAKLLGFDLAPRGEARAQFA